VTEKDARISDGLISGGQREQSFLQAGFRNKHRLGKRMPLT
jgi:hypothetical protein